MSGSDAGRGRGGDDRARDGNRDSDGADGGRDGDGGSGESQRPSTAEKVTTAVSVLFTVSLFAFLVWQTLQAPAAGSPDATVESVERLPDGRVGVTVVLTNTGREGLLSATVAVDCDRPPPSVQFTHVSVDGRQTAVVACPAGTGQNATANVTVWQTA